MTSPAKTHNTILLEWGEPTEGNGIIIGYRISYSYPIRVCINGLRSSETTNHTVTTNTNSTSVTLDENNKIYPYWNYVITVAANNSVGLGEESDRIVVTTAEDSKDLSYYSVVVTSLYNVN